MKYWTILCDGILQSLEANAWTVSSFLENFVHSVIVIIAAIIQFN
jgi:hypothetical protein